MTFTRDQRVTRLDLIAKSSTPKRHLGWFFSNSTRISTPSRPVWKLNSGTTLAETVVAVLIVGIAFFSIYASLSAGFASVQVSRENLRGTQILLEKLETIRLYSWDQIGTANFIPTTFTAPFNPNASSNAGFIYSGTLTITNSPLTERYSNDVKLVTVEVTWTSANVQRKRTMSSYVSRQGLQNYIY